MKTNEGSMWGLREIHSQAEVERMLGMTKAPLHKSEERALGKLHRGLAKLKLAAVA